MKKTKDEKWLRRYWFQKGDTTEIHISNVLALMADVRAKQRRADIAAVRKYTQTNGGGPEYLPLYADEVVESAINAIRKRGRE